MNTPNFKTCADCHFFVVNTDPQQIMEAAKSGIKAGLCNAMPPVPVLIGMGAQGAALQAMYPPIQSDSRACGQYTPPAPLQ